ncbi:hypothetical protein PP568_06700 [Mycobacteroides abscessus]|uniref:Uncharacterized protein n=1 Tax=Mycobacteroides abscessus subsp. abscessus TaxID=1185650 RepID=A0AB38D339_9MYCO|nr:hypothetical protein [Mycobacteroides abscessus]MBE5419542.1 hypothetical protein [Mycobacteroides abscessus]MBE5455759.1 hypothetical protein [Mycobacteroides abscessus]MBN7555227.1 hypothetical protein [Mycobacteroides abscessus subsp. abscessus]MDM2404619.1 hypothetical protein [Mycobacteroides abscessus]MDM2414337.1 hypothetical protein [Mycobacteroides abscessus]
MNAVTVSRILIFVESDADRVAAALAAIAETRVRAVPTTRSDGTETLSHRVLVGATRFELAEGRPAAPPVIELTTVDPIAAGERLTAAGFTAAAAMDGTRVRTRVAGISIHAARAEA